MAVQTQAQTWAQELAMLRQRADALCAAGPLPDPLRREEGEGTFAQLRATARTLFRETIHALAEVCPTGYPVIDDNEIGGTGGAVGIRFDEHHSFFFALERAKVASKAAQPKGLSSKSDPPRRRMPGDPLPPRDPEEPVRLAMTALRWDEQTGWSEMRRVLDPRWDERLLREHLAAYLVGTLYDLTVAARPAAR